VTPIFQVDAHLLILILLFLLLFFLLLSAPYLRLSRHHLLCGSLFQRGDVTFVLIFLTRHLGCSIPKELQGNSNEKKRHRRNQTLGRQTFPTSLKIVKRIKTHHSTNFRTPCFHVFINSYLDLHLVVTEEKKTFNDENRKIGYITISKNGWWLPIHHSKKTTIKETKDKRQSSPSAAAGTTTGN